MVDDHLGSRIRAARQARGMSLRDLGALNIEFRAEGDWRAA